MSNGALSYMQIAGAVENLPPAELEALLQRVLALRATQRAPHRRDMPARLLTVINQRLPTPDLARLHDLRAIRQHRSLESVEQTEIVALTNRLEELQAQRLAALAELAQVRGVTLPTVIAQLGLKFPDHD